ncbi:MAG: Uma2 family endonuclease [Gemmatimonadota bacterium]
MTTRPNPVDERLSVEEFQSLPEEEGYRLELSRGRIVREPAPGPRHGHLTGRLYRALAAFAEDEGLGLVFVDTAFVLSSAEGIVRAPDVAFVSSERVPPQGVTDRFWELAPDVAVEVVSPSNTVSAMQRKALEYLDAGAPLVWIVDPAERTATVHRGRDDIRILAEADALEGGEALPGFRLALADLFG